MALMRLEKIVKKFGAGDQQTTALDQIDLTIEKGQFIGCLLYTSDAADE